MVVVSGKEFKMEEIINQAKILNMSANTIEYLMFLNHVMNEMTHIEDLISE